MHSQHMERWELYRGRAKGREDVYARGRCWGWLQPATGGGHTAHTTAGPVPGGPHPTGELALQNLPCCPETEFGRIPLNERATR